MEQFSDDTKVPLAPSRKSSLNVRCNTAQENRKRHASAFDDHTSITSSFDAVTFTPTTSQQALTFVPISIVLRAHVPLSWLSGSNDHYPTPGSLLTANITGITKWDYHVLVARLVTNRALFAFERVDTNVYVCYPLQSWVKVQWVEQAAYGAAPTVDIEFLLGSQRGSTHSRKPSITSVISAVEPLPGPASPRVPKNRRGELARLSIFESKERMDGPTGLICERSQEVVQELEPLESQGGVEQGGVAQDTAIGQPYTTLQMSSTSECVSNIVRCTDIPEDATIMTIDPLSSEHLRRQYLETLYLSKTSLAFYAKGPLSRARARARVFSASRSSESLAEFYRESILSTKKLDLKYKESVQSKIGDLATRDQDGAINAKQVPRKTKRTKLGKDGLWPLEDEYILQWWRGQEFAAGSSQTFEVLAADTKKFVSQLRMRETEMQILLILEVLALEARDIPNQQTAGVPEVLDAKVVLKESEGPGLSPKALAMKKARNLRSELDFLIDRLCIWHSIGFEDIAAPANMIQKSGSSMEKLKDRLRDFCKDVIVPFYGGKLPEQCHTICVKIGGPEVSPRRPKLVPEKDSSQGEPGAAITHDRVTGKRNLKRVLSESQSIRHASPPVLSRSATLPTPIGIKREPSERPISRSGMQKSVSFSNREVDLVADARVTAAKRRKLDLVTAQKRELDAAIENLKRPNRSTVAKSFMDDVERRTTENMPTSGHSEAVQISATPKRGRAKQLQSDEYDLPPIPTKEAPQEEAIVPSSTVKPRGLGQLSSIPRSSAKKRAVLSAIHDTPSKSAAQSVQSTLATSEQNSGCNRVLDRASSSTLITSTPVKSRLRADLDENVAVTPMRMSKSLKPVLLAPMKRSEVSMEQVFKDAPEIPECAGKTMDRVMGSKTDAAEASLYDSLGWNDDYDL